MTYIKVGAKVRYSTWNDRAGKYTYHAGVITSTADGVVIDDSLRVTRMDIVGLESDCRGPVVGPPDGIDYPGEANLRRLGNGRL